MAKIVAQITRAEGTDDVEHYFEIQLKGCTLQITVSNDHFNVISARRFKEVSARACNSVHILPQGSKFSSIQEYHEEQDRRLSGMMNRFGDRLNRD